MISIFNKDYCEFEEFKLNETPLFEKGVIIIECRHQCSPKVWSADSIEEAILICIKDYTQRRRGDVDVFDDIETVAQLKEELSKDLRSCQIIEFDNFEPEDCGQAVLREAVSLDWLVKAPCDSDVYDTLLGYGDI